MRILHPLLLALSLAACGGGSDDPVALKNEGYKLLASDPDAALAKFEAARKAIGDDASNPNYVGVRMGAIEALVQVDADRARDDMLALDKAHPGKLTAQDFSVIGSKLASERKFSQAIAVVDAAKKKWPDEPKLDLLIQNLEKSARAAGDAGALNALESLGYIGDE